MIRNASSRRPPGALRTRPAPAAPLPLLRAAGLAVGLAGAVAAGLAAGGGASAAASPPPERPVAFQAPDASGALPARSPESDSTVRRAADADAESAVGLRTLRIPTPGRDAPLDATLWYPASPGGTPVDVGADAVFVGSPAHRDAPFAPGAHPLVAVSHGGGGNPGQYGWIANALVAAGFAVVAPAHPGSTTGDASPAEAVKLWRRPGHVSATLDALLADPALAGRLDPERIGALGFSAGGHTALALVGARTDARKLAGFCDGDGGGMSDCAFLAAGGIDLHAIDLSPAADDLSDRRVRSAVVVDPGTVETLEPTSLERVDVPVLFLNLGRPGEIPRAVDAAAAARRVPGATYVTVAGATHFSFLPECTAKGPAILAEEGEPDALCGQGGGRARGELHRELGERIAARFERTLR